MRLFVNVKQLGNRKNFITKEELVIDIKPKTLRELIEAIIKVNVRDYNKRVKEKAILEFLTDDEINSKIIGGKVSFGELYNESEAKLTKALECAFLAYEDGIYRVFLGNREAGQLDDKLEVSEDEVLTFIRLTMLAGRMW